MRKPILTFYLDDVNHRKIPDKLGKELYALDLFKIEYTIFWRQNVLLPRLGNDGYQVAGLSDIQHSLRETLLWYSKELYKELDELDPKGIVI